MIIRFEIRTVSEANQREHWATKNRRKKSQQKAFSDTFRAKQPSIPVPTVFTFTRYSCMEMDADNLAGSFKHVQDQLAREIGIDDGDHRISFKYEQVRIPKRQHYFELKIERRE